MAIASLDDLDGADEPDFSLADDEGEAYEAVPAATGAANTALRHRTAALEKLRELRGLRGGGPPATPEMRQKMMHTVIEPLGNNRAQDLIVAVWNPLPGERLNAARTRALVEWAVADDDFDSQAVLMIQLAQENTQAGEH